MDRHSLLVAFLFYLLTAVAGVPVLEVVVFAHAASPSVVRELRTPLLVLDLDGGGPRRPIRWFFMTGVQFQFFSVFPLGCFALSTRKSWLFHFFDFR